ncbi:hypothetical protein PGT21_013617 [Puccinia graminis f. sp. tritici]|uniref:Uncharacterized protein n=1 Tax=Puccinia graminis f. sp. tritici TaxID=56615 RepID=A0A5B0M5X4_PUCGR|nr:hypothetical protein PGTUg99_019860 [Puccinia graminis f. sp. tritici]KAA1071639.1 hypothetical protein PGT21_013617 [Puccinia graminis f. sp. tritici]
MMMKLIVLVVSYLQTIQCMNGGRGGITHELLAASKGKNAARIAEAPSFKEGDINLYFTTVRAFTRPAPGSYKDKLDLTIAKPKDDQEGSSEKFVLDTYWPAVQAKLLWEDFNVIATDLLNVKKTLEIEMSKRAWFQQKSISSRNLNKALLKHATELEYILSRLEEHIENSFHLWAKNNKFPDPKIFAKERFFTSSSSFPSLNSFRLKMHPDLVIKNFPRGKLQTLSVDLRYAYSDFKDHKNQHVMTLRRIYLLTLDQVYKYDLIDDKMFKYLHKGWCSSDISPTHINMFHHFYHFEKEPENSIFKISNIILKGWHLSPFLNQAKVLEKNFNMGLSYHIVLEYSRNYKANTLDSFEDLVEKTVKSLFKDDALIKTLEYTEKNRYGVDYRKHETAKDGVIMLIDILNSPDVWSKEWQTNEALRIVGEIIQFVDEHGLETEGMSPIKDRFDATVRNKLELIACRNQDLLELENIYRYLKNEFPLSNKIGISRIPPLEELKLIENWLRKYHKADFERMDVNMEVSKKEIEVRVQFLEDEMNKLRKKYSESGTSLVFESVPRITLQSKKGKNPFSV